MECHEGATMIKTFRGLIAHGTQDTITLHNNNGSTGYRIVKLQVMASAPGDGADSENVIMVWKVARTPTEIGDTTTTNPDFSNNQLLGVGAMIQDTGGSGHGYWQDVIFDNEIFNQDIFVTCRDVSGSGLACNYYIELEQIKLDLSESTVATLKDIRNIEQPA
jgi:hypothetical protein